MSDSDLETSDELAASSSKSCKKRKTKTWYNQPFCVDWLQDEHLKDWIESDPKDKFSVRCKVCNITLKNANKSGLMAHKSTKKHITNFETRTKMTTITTLFKQPRESPIKEKVANAELLLTAFFADHHVPFQHADHLVDCLKKMFPDSAICKAVSMKRTKISYLMQDGIALEEKNDIAKICQQNKFSVIIDESTDISVSQVLAVMVRYYDETTCQVVDALLDCIEVEDASGEGLYISFKQLLKDKHIPQSNILGFASDNCSTMTGKYSGFQAYLRKDILSVFVLGCVCHSLALCANYASKSLPSWLEMFLKNVCCYFTRSSKRLHSFQLIQDFVKVPDHRMIKLAQTRWLSQGKVVSHILEQWDALLLFFQIEATSDKVDGAGEMNTAGTKHMLLFVNYIIAKVDRMNIEFQSEHLRIHKVFASISDDYRSLMDLYIRPEIMHSTNLSQIDPLDTTLYKKLEDIDVGGRCENMLKTQSLEDKEIQFRRDALSFLTNLCDQIKKRFPLSSDSVLSQLRVLDVDESLSSEHRLNSLIPLASKFPALVAESELDFLQDEWKALLYSKDSLANLSNHKPEVFWYKLRTVKDGNNKQKFGLISKFMCGLMELPHSSACVERVFSQVNIVKTSVTNRLHVSTVANRLLAKQAISRRGVECHSWVPPKNLIADVMNGRCYQHYVERVKGKQRQQTLVTIHEEDDAYDTIN
ncbi:hypothetical protein BsWGS_24058 [Bradybaena similaris]